MRLVLILTLLLCSASSLVLAAGEGDAVAACLPAGYREDLRLEILNQAGGAIRASRDGGQSWRVVGEVLLPLRGLNPQGYRASAWVPDSTVAATAVNGIHVKVRAHPETGRGVIFSLVPRGDLVGAARSPSSLVTDSPPGEGLFGGLGPTVASPVLHWAGDRWQPLGAAWTPAEGERLLLVRMVPQRAVRYVDFENLFGGRITLTYTDGGEELIGQVLTPVTGIGRFEGGRYAAAGRVRANHAGVLDISTSPYGYVGGFQIIPWHHANDTEMSYVRTNRQWMVVGPLDRREGSWEGKPPLFAGLIYPSYRAGDLWSDAWASHLLSRAQVLCRRGEGDWELLPRIAFSPEAPPDSPRPTRGTVWWIHEPGHLYAPLPPIAQQVLADVTAVRLALPLEPYWPEEGGEGDG